jgi:hypothetical protein
MKYLLLFFTFALLLGGCTAGHLSLIDNIKGPSLKAASTPSATDANNSRVSPKKKATSATIAEPIEASFSETAYIDRF